MPVQRSGTSFQAIARFAELADYSIAFAVRAVAKLGVADHLAEGGKSVVELASVTDTHPPSLLRAMRALASKGVFAEPQPSFFELTDLGQLLRTDHPLSMRYAFRLNPDVRALAELGYSIRTGKPSFDHVFGMEYWDYLPVKPELLAEFQQSQRALTRLEMLTLLRVYDWSSLRSLVDIGGNDGTFLSEILIRNPSMQGTLFDLRDTVSAAPKILTEAGVADRCTVVPGSFFDTQVPPGADAYLIKRVMVGLDDERAVTLLRSVRAAMRPDSRLIILEPISNTGGDDISSDMDLLMLVLGNGRVRTAEEHAANFAKADLVLGRVIASRPSTIVEATPM